MVGKGYTSEDMSRKKDKLTDDGVVLRHWPIKEVYVDLHCVSLTTFLGFDEDRAHDSENASQNLIQSNMQRRFIPLIIDAEHADRALPLLMEELVRMDCLKGDFYTFSGGVSRKQCSMQDEPSSCEAGGAVTISPLPVTLAWKALEVANASSSQASIKKKSSRRKNKMSDIIHADRPHVAPALSDIPTAPKWFGYPTTTHEISAEKKTSTEASECVDMNEITVNDCTLSADAEGYAEENYRMLIRRDLGSPRLPVFDSTIGFRVISAVMNSMISQFVMAAENKIQLSSHSLVGMLYNVLRDYKLCLLLSP